MQVHDELAGYDKTLALFQNTDAAEWEGVVASQRLQLTSEFFDHVENLIHAAHQDQQQREGKVSYLQALLIITSLVRLSTAEQNVLSQQLESHSVYSVASKGV